MKYILFISALLCSVLLTSCAHHSQDYLKQGGQVNPLVVPSGVPPLKQQDYFPIPKSTGQATSKSVSIKPPTMNNTHR